LKKSTIGCAKGGLITIENENQTTTETAEQPTNKIINVFQGELHFRRLLGKISGKTFNYGNKGDYALFPDGFKDIVKTQCYGFDWIRDVLDGEEDYLNRLSGNLVKEKFVKDGANISYKGKYIHLLGLNLSSDRKVTNEYFYFFAETITTRISSGATTKISCNDIFEYDINRIRKTTHQDGTPVYANIIARIGANYSSVQSVTLLSSFLKLIRDFTPIKQYVNTPKGTFMAGSNLSNAVYEINHKDYFVPWLTIMPLDTVKVQAVTFVDVAPPPGEIRFTVSSPEITIAPSKISVPGLLSYPTNTQNAPVSASNIEIIEIGSSSTGFDKDQIVEARFFDNSRLSEPDYLGEVIGLLNICRNKPVYTVNCYFVRVYFTDRTNRTGIGYPLNSIVPSDSVHTQAAQLINDDKLKNLFSTGNLQDEYMRLMFKQALIEYTTSGIHPISDIEIDFNDFVPVSEGNISGISTKDLGNICYKYSSQLLNKLATNRPLNDGITFFLLPYEISNLFGKSHGIGRDTPGINAQSVLITQLMFSSISNDRATAIHEGAHSLGLYHTFIESGDDINQYLCLEGKRRTIFLNDRTENVMDYTPTARSFYRWQWEKMQNDHPDIKPKT
jgi:hypothetical protein